MQDSDSSDVRIQPVRSAPPTSILELTDDERRALQKVVMSKLGELDLGCTVVVPKGQSVLRVKSIALEICVELMSSKLISSAAGCGGNSRPVDAANHSIPQHQQP
jgi:hypothetical protein